MKAVSLHEQPAIPTLTRHLHPHTQRRVAFYEPATGLCLLENGAQVRAETLSDLLFRVLSTSAPHYIQTIYLCGGDISLSTPSMAWWLEPVARGASMDRWHSDVNRRSARYHLPDYRHIAIDVRMTAPWFGDEQSAGICLAAWLRLLDDLRATFPRPPEFPPLALLPTPGRTGLELLEATLPFGASYPILPDRDRMRLHDLFTQGRKELFTADMPTTLDELYCVDARWMYAACVHALPAGPCEHDDHNEWAGVKYGGPEAGRVAPADYVPGFYCVTAKVPQQWRHIGLLPTRSSEGGWTWPRKPGEAFVSWCSGAELQLALREGWVLRIIERYRWPESGNKAGDLAKQWIARLRQLRENYQDEWAQHDVAVAECCAGAVRHLVIDTVGHWHRVARREHGYVPRDGLHLMPEDAIPHFDGESGMFSWWRETALAPEDAIYAHPEWSATVWGRARARLTRAALALPFGEIMALRSDAIWTTGLAGVEELTARDDGKPGSWRIKHHLLGPVPAPQSETQFRAVLRRARIAEDGEGEGGAA